LSGRRSQPASSCWVFEQRSDIRTGHGAYDPPGKRRSIVFVEDPFAVNAVQYHTSRFEHRDQRLGSAARDALGEPFPLALGEPFSLALGPGCARPARPELTAS
jgi:hypothetical protein